MYNTIAMKDFFEEIINEQNSIQMKNFESYMEYLYNQYMYEEITIDEMNVLIFEAKLEDFPTDYLITL